MVHTLAHDQLCLSFEREFHLGSPLSGRDAREISERYPNYIMPGQKTFEFLRKNALFYLLPKKLGTISATCSNELHGKTVEFIAVKE